MPPQMSSEKFMRAERKNRLENYRLKITYNHYDKETVRMNYEIDREKRSITKSFRNVIKTSGASDLGIPPKDENDTDFEKCPSYTQGLKLSNKRLMEWRECEKQLNKFIQQHEVERAKQKRKKYFKKNGEEYNVLPAKKIEDYEDTDDVFLDNESVTNIEKSSPIDILKENPFDTSEKFDISKWEAEIIEGYKTMVCDTPILVNDNQRVKQILKSKSSPSFSSQTSEFENSKNKRVRPHTAQARTRPPSGRSSIPQRPSSAVLRNENNKSPFLITKNGIYIKTGHSFEKLLDNRPPETPVMVNNFIKTNAVSMTTTSTIGLKPPGPSATEKAPSIASVSTLCPVQEDNEEDETDHSKIDEVAAENHMQTEEDEEIQDNNTSSLENHPKSALALKFQRRLKQKLERTRSATSSQQSMRSNFKHSNSDLSSYIESSRKSRRDSSSATSMISIPRSRTGSIVSSHRPSISLGIPADIEEISKGQDKLMSEIRPDRPLAANKIVCVSKIVKAAMTFSRVARKRALLKMQEENSSDAHEIVRQERIRKLQSRQNVLNSIASQWTLDENTIIEQVE